MLGVTGLGRDAVEIVMGSMSHEIWRKRSIDIHILNELFEDQKIDLNKLLFMRADLTFINVLILLINKCRINCYQDLRKMIKNGGIALATFYNTDDVSQSPIVTSAAKKFELANCNRTQNATMCDLGRLISYIAAQQQEDGRVLIDLTKTLFLAFIAARMMDLT
ncbi:MAG: hypothetical protein EZS28_011293 [Streblomastix strix]|uniref:Uncharacterized protein n=1 Tax=Streblomastix strix TaxID=222440 RepID=A0A5J4WE48_9EUKA|nr:MAG: hypothetical protein EZS28_011293 [Streblomastix strix]